jgi:hypothetical protein
MIALMPPIAIIRAVYGSITCALVNAKGMITARIPIIVRINVLRHGKL